MVIKHEYSQEIRAYICGRGVGNMIDFLLTRSFIYLVYYMAWNIPV